MKKLLLLTTLITVNAYANTQIRLEYDTRTEKIKILDKKPDKACIKQINESKKLLKTSTKNLKGKIKLNFICMQ